MALRGEPGLRSIMMHVPRPQKRQTSVDAGEFTGSRSNAIRQAAHQFFGHQRKIGRNVEHRQSIHSPGGELVARSVANKVGRGLSQ